MERPSNINNTRKRAAINNLAHRLFLLSIQDDKDDEAERMLNEFRKQPEADEITKEIIQSVIDSTR